MKWRTLEKINWTFGAHTLHIFHKHTFFLDAAIFHFARSFWLASIWCNNYLEMLWRILVSQSNMSYTVRLRLKFTLYFTRHTTNDNMRTVKLWIILTDKIIYHILQKIGRCSYYIRLCGSVGWPGAYTVCVWREKDSVAPE